MGKFAGMVPIQGLEKETLDKQYKCYKKFQTQLDEGQRIVFTGMFKYVDSGLTDKFNLPIYKRKRIFSKHTKLIR